MQSAKAYFSLPWGQGLQSTQRYFTLPWGHGLHSLHWYFCLACEHCLLYCHHARSVTRHRTSRAPRSAPAHAKRRSVEKVVAFFSWTVRYLLNFQVGGVFGGKTKNPAARDLRARQPPRPGDDARVRTSRTATDPGVDGALDWFRISSDD